MNPDSNPDKVSAIEPERSDGSQQRMVSGRLDADQLKNWRNALLGMIGPWALMMPDEDVQRMRDEMQRRFGDESANDKLTHGGESEIKL